MLTPQEVSTHAFTKAMMGGYNMTMVDEFLDQLTEDYTALYKENATLKAKLKVLVEKVEEYRATEDSMRATLLTAQRMADSIVHEAEARRDQLLTQAEQEIRTQKGTLEQELDAMGMRLRQGEEELARFIAASREICSREMQFLEQLPRLSVPAAAAAPPPAEAIEERVLASFPEMPREEAAPAPETTAVPAAAVPEEETGETVEATRRINLEDLKFGRNYTSGG